MQDRRYEAAGMIRNGTAYEDIASATGYTVSYVRLLAHRLGIKKKLPSTELYERIVQLWKDGMRKSDIARTVGCAPSCVTRALKKNNLEIRRYAMSAVPKPQKSEEVPEISDEELALLPHAENRANVCRIICNGKAYLDVTQIYFPM